MSNTSLNLMARMAAEYGVDKDKLAKTLSTTIFGQKEGNQIIPPTPEEMMTLLVICDQYKLNPFTRQVYAFAKGGKGCANRFHRRLVGDHQSSAGL